jgi:hypothetical protein
MIRKCISLFIVAVLSTVLVAGCGGTKEVDPYAEVSLRQATYGPPVISKGYKYKIVNPQIIEASGHLCLVREGNVTTMIAGRSIADKIEAMDRSNITFNVVKKYSPYVHFKCEQVISGQDTVFISSAGSIFYPKIKKAAEFRAKDYDQTDLDKFKWNDSAGLTRAVDKKFAVTGTIARVEEDGDNVWMISGGRETTFRVQNPDDSIRMVLRMLADANMGFTGGITFVGEEEWAARRDNHISGDVTVEWVQYGDVVFSL